MSVADCTCHFQGIISNSDDKRDIELIEEMVKNSISGNTLILLTVTMKGEQTPSASIPSLKSNFSDPVAPPTDDLQNQKAVLLAKEADPEGKRTIGKHRLPSGC